MEKLINCLDLRNGKIKVNGEEFMALPVALNESFSWVVCEWQHLSKLAANRFKLLYSVDSLSVDYIVVSRFRTLHVLEVEVYVGGIVHSRSTFSPQTVLKTKYTVVERKLAENAI